MLKPWREAIMPHPDVATGKYRQAEFAADLSQVISGKAEFEYQNPAEFFKRTYLTEGIRHLLVEAINRISDNSGDPVIQLKTSFGGGKTHTMLALYHLLGGKTPVNELFDCDTILSQSKSKVLPKAKIAVLVGTAISVTTPKKYGQIHTNTLWGNMAAQLGQEEAFAMIRKDDEVGTAPGADKLVEIFEKFGPCIILIDELVAYARNIYGKENISSGTFDSLMTFIQNLTEAAKRSRNTLVVAAIPESDIEIGGTAGKAALERIENIFGRVETVWKPVNPVESFEIVRRRLFGALLDQKARDDVCTAFSKLYSQSNSDFPSECKEVRYYERMKASYPIHPEVFDRLYDDWSVIENFQKTRGVLRLMAAVIHELWMKGDKSFLIMPGSIPIDASQVRNELTRYLQDSWNTVIDKDVDGERSEPLKIDEENPRFGSHMAARRVSRTIFLGSAPSVDAQKVRGIEDVRIRLGVIQPGEQIALFNDALGKLMDRLAHLYAGNKRYWFDTQPNLRRVVEDRASRLDIHEILVEIEQRLQTRERGDFHAVQICPISIDVPDEQEVRLVVLPLKAGHRNIKSETSALTHSREILEKRGDLSRQYKNMLIFVAPDSDLVNNLEEEVRRFIAWQSVLDDADSLNLDGDQRKQAKDSVDRSNKTVDIRILETYSWLLVPTQEGTSPLTWSITKMAGSESYVMKASKKLKISEQLITKWSPALLKMELDKWLWKDTNHIGLKKLWEFMSMYPYLTRLKDSDVLVDAIKEGLKSKDYFGYATGIDEKGNYLGLSFGSVPSSIYLDGSSILIKLEVARKHLQMQQTASEKHVESETIRSTEEMEKIIQPQPVMQHRFYGTVSLDWAKLGTDAGKVAEEIVQHLKALVDSRVEINLEINAEAPHGIPDNIVRTIAENCKTLKFKHFDFEEK
ncbi:MAG: ATP-binding protein [Thaumarchaeota archaeon]|nr:ATP-binding protein [Nitrososphaerota archaeon]